MGEVDDRLELERGRQSKLEEALEIKSLRRIISAYLNYPDAAENDIRRYERSFTKLPPAHKALLSHFPLKFENLRRCIRVNTYFIMSMLQAFDPPLDMNQDIDIDKGGNLEHHHECPCSDSVPNHEANLISRRSLFACGETPVSEAQAATSKTSSDFDQKCLEKNHSGERQEFFTGISQKILSGDESGNKELRQVMDNASLDGAKVISDQDRHDCGSVANGSVTCSPCDWLDPSLQLNVPLVDVDKVRCIVRNIVRDWAPEGQKERDQCYKPILEELDRLFPDRCKNWPPTCLVPGAGLGRLALEISCLGFVSQGNEFSYYMMICSSFILNHAETAGQWTIYPWIHSNCNSLSDNDQLRAVSFPDIHPASAGITEGFSMCGGDFVEVYNDKSQEASWDAVVTCFFLDTAHNIVEYIEIISKILKDGGVWINFGPLLYHFADSYGADDDMSIELSLEDVKKVVLHYGFEIEVEKIIQTTYTANPRSMMQNQYFAAFWSMKRKPRV